MRPEEAERRSYRFKMLSLDADNLVMAGSGTPTTMLQTATLGDLLVEQRTGASTSISVLSESSGLTVEQIEAVESDRHDLTPAELRRLLASYDFKRPFGRLAKPIIEISLEDGWITMVPTRQLWTTSAAADENLVCYLNLLHQSRGLDYGTQVPLKSVDLSLLRAALAIRKPDVQAHLGRLGLSLPQPITDNRGLVIGAASSMALVAGIAVLAPGSWLSPQDHGPIYAVIAPGSALTGTETVRAATTVQPIEQAATPIPDPDVEIGSALIVERDAQTALTEWRSGQTNQAATTDPNIEVGIAVVVERPADEAGPVDPEESSRTSRGPPETERPVSKGRN